MQRPGGIATRRPEDWARILSLRSLLYLLVVIIILAGGAIAYYVHSSLKAIEDELPVNLAEQERAVSDLVLGMSDLLRLARLMRLDPDEARLQGLKAQLGRIEAEMRSIRSVYDFDSLIGASAIHAVINPTLIDIRRWLTQGVQGLSPTDPATLVLVEQRASGAYARSLDIFRGVHQTVLAELTAQSMRIQEYRQRATWLFAVLVVLSLILLYLCHRQILAERAHEESEMRFRDVAEAASDWFWETDDGLRLTFVSARQAEITGLPTESLLGRTPREIFAERGVEEAERAAIDAHLADLDARRSYRDFVFTTLTPDGDRRVLRSSAVAFYNSAGRFKGYRGVGSDITQQHRAEEALRESELRFRTVFESANVAILLVDPSGRILRVNQSFCDFVGYSEAELCARDVLSITHPEDRATTATNLERIRSGRETSLIVEKRYLHRDGRERWGLLSSTAVLDGDGRPRYLVSMIQDITDHRRAEEELRHSQKMEAVGQLTGGLAHDFNNLLAVVLGNAERIGDRLGADDPQLRALIRAATRGSELTQRLLAFSRKQALVPQVINLNASIASVAAVLKRALGETIEIRTAFEEELWNCEVDPGQLESALLNLALNARDAMPSGGRMTIGTSNLPAGDDSIDWPEELPRHDHVLLSVSDTGCGMAEPTLSRVFEPFFTTKEVGKGSGLGLSMVFGFVKQSGGQLTIDSAEGAGTTVLLCLPRSQRWIAPAESTAEAAPRPRDVTSGRRLLVVEDEDDVRELMVGVLQDLGYGVRSAKDADEALQVMESENRVDLLLTDVVLPNGMMGTELAALVVERWRGTRVLFMSGHAESALINQGILEAGALFLRKPFRRNLLAETIQRTLDEAVQPSLEV